MTACSNADDNALETTVPAAENPPFPRMISPRASARPVQFGFDGPDMEACGGYGEVSGLEFTGETVLSVYAAPTADAENIDELPARTPVYLCEYTEDWIGIVYPSSGTTDEDCMIDDAIDPVQDYDGPCPSGWVIRDYVTLIED